MVELADTLVDDFDVVELLDAARRPLRRGPRRLGGRSDPGRPRRRAAGDGLLQRGHALVLELFELQAEEGPCMDCFRTGRSGREPGPRRRPTAAGPGSGREALEAGFRSVHALPMRLRGRSSAL